MRGEDRVALPLLLKPWQYLHVRLRGWRFLHSGERGGGVTTGYVRKFSSDAGGGTTMSGSSAGRRGDSPGTPFDNPVAGELEEELAVWEKDARVSMRSGGIDSSSHLS